MTTLVGVDAGGTSSRAVVCDETGAVLGRGRAAGANIRSATGDPATNLATAVRDALAQAAAAGDPQRARSGRLADAVCVGIAGTEARREEVEALVARAMRAAGLDVAPVVVPDLEIAYRAVASSPDGLLLLAGTGAITARFAGWQVQARRDGLGWLLGDSGSGVWIGRRVLRVVAAALDGGPATALTAPVLAAFDLPPDADAHDLVRATDGLPPAAWGRVAPFALTCADDDEAAAAIVRGAAAALLEALAGVSASGTPGPVGAREVVLAGGLLAGGPLRAAFEAAVPVAGHAEHPVVGAVVASADSVGIALAPDDVRGALA